MKTVTNENQQNRANPAEFLRSIFLSRRERNSGYSTRAFARDLGISQALLSYLLSGKRPLTVKLAAQISVALRLSPEDSERLVESALMALPSNAKALRPLLKKRAQEGGAPRPSLFLDLEIERYRAISQWYHLAILDLTTIQGFKNNTAWIAKKLRITRIHIESRWLIYDISTLLHRRIQTLQFFKLH